MFSNMVKFLTGAAMLSFIAAAPASATVLPNQALNGTASQSSTYGPLPVASVASNAIDGNTNGAWNFGNQAANSLSHTNSQQGAWWQVDLGKLINIDEIDIWNRTDCCTARLNDFNVLLDGLIIASYHQADGPAPTFTLSNLNLTGQVVGVQLTDTNYLHLAEVQVFGTAVPEPAPIALMGLGLLALGIGRKRRR